MTDRKSSPETPNALDATWTEIWKRFEKLQADIEALKVDLQRWIALRKTRP